MPKVYVSGKDATTESEPVTTILLFNEFISIGTPWEFAIGVSPKRAIDVGLVNPEIIDET